MGTQNMIEFIKKHGLDEKIVKDITKIKKVNKQNKKKKPVNKLDALNKSGDTQLIEAAMNNSTQKCKSLLEQKADPNVGGC